MEKGSRSGLGGDRAMKQDAEPEPLAKFTEALDPWLL
jgi:hypothetical protein